MTLLGHERDMLGLYVSDHPLLGLEHVLSNGTDCTIGQLMLDEDRADGSRSPSPAWSPRVQRKITKRGDAWAMVTLEDLDGAIDVLLFPSAYQLAEHLSRRGRDHHGQGPALAQQGPARAARPGGHAPRPLRRPDRAGGDQPAVDPRAPPPVVEQLKEVLGTHPGMTEVRLQAADARRRPPCMRLDDRLRVTPSPALFADLKQLLGPGCLTGLSVARRWRHRARGLVVVVALRRRRARSPASCGSGSGRRTVGVVVDHRWTADDAFGPASRVLRDRLLRRGRRGRRAAWSVSSSRCSLDRDDVADAGRGASSARCWRPGDAAVGTALGPPDPDRPGRDRGRRHPSCRAAARLAGDSPCDRAPGRRADRPDAGLSSAWPPRRPTTDRLRRPTASDPPSTPSSPAASTRRPGRRIATSSGHAVSDELPARTAPTDPPAGRGDPRQRAAALGSRPRRRPTPARGAPQRPSSRSSAASSAPAAVGGGAWAAVVLLDRRPAGRGAAGGARSAYAASTSTRAAGRRSRRCRTLNKFPAFKDERRPRHRRRHAQGHLRRASRSEAGCDGLDYADDIEPWLGDRAAVAAVDTGGDEPAAGRRRAGHRRRKPPRTGLAKLSACGGDGEPSETSAWRDRRRLGRARRDQETLDQVVDAAAEKATLADDDDFQKWTGEAGDAGVVDAVRRARGGERPRSSHGPARRLPGMPLRRGARARRSTRRGSSRGPRGLRGRRPPPSASTDGALEIEDAAEPGAATEQAVDRRRRRRRRSIGRLAARGHRRGARHRASSEGWLADARSTSSPPALGGGSADDLLARSRPRPASTCPTTSRP